MRDKGNRLKPHSCKELHIDVVILQEPGRFECIDRDSPQPEVGEALVRVRSIGVCGSDHHAFAGKMPFVQCPRVLGHELGVEVLEVGPNDHGVHAGDHCAVEPYLSCGRCGPCNQGRTNCCQHLRVLGIHTDGGMCPYLAVPTGLLHRSERLSYDQLALVETLGIGAHAVARCGLRAGERTLVVGLGAIGLGTLQFVRATGAEVEVADTNPQRRAFVEQAFQITAKSGPENGPYDVVFDATGNATAMEAGFEQVAAGGRLVFVGLTNQRLTFSTPPFHPRELTLYASRNSCHQFRRIIDLIEAGTIDTAPWVTHRMGLLEVPDRFAEIARATNMIKTLIEVDG